MNGFSILLTKGAIWISYVPYFKKTVIYLCYTMLGRKHSDPHNQFRARWEGWVQYRRVFNGFGLF